MRNGLAAARLGHACFGALLIAVLGLSRPALADDPFSLVPPRPAGSAPLEALRAFFDGLAGAPEGLGGGGRSAPTEHSGALPLGAIRWTDEMDRHEIVVGAIDPDHDDAYAYRLPYADHVSFPVIQGYGARLSHRGAEQYTVDFGMPPGTPVHAARDGVVVLVEDSHDIGCWREECGRLANFVVVLHSDGTTGEYFHLQKGSVQVRRGERVRRGQLLASSGNTGYTTAPHLHFGVYRAARDGRTQSIAVRFATREGVIAEPRTGARYLNLPLVPEIGEPRARLETAAARR